MELLQPGQFDSFAAGMNNRRADFKMRTQAPNGDTTHFLRSIVNADVTKEGTLHRRPGYARVVDGAACRSLWSDGVNTFYADGANLIRLTGDNPFTSTVLYSSLVGDQPVSFASVNNDVYWSDGHVLHRIDAAGDHTNGVAPLLQDPTVIADIGGSMPSGRYVVCCTFRNSDGEESASSFPVQVDVAGGAISVTNLPATWPADAAALAVYMTSPNGSEMMRAALLLAPATSVTFPTMPSLYERCSTVLLAPMPAGDIVRYLNGRLLVAAGNTLFYSEPYALALRNPARNYVQFPVPISVMEPVNNGFFLCADQTYWIAGDIASAELNPVLPYGGVFGASVQVTNENAAFWMSPRGMVRGDQDGSVKNLQESNVAVETAQAGAALYRERDGMKQALASLFGERPTLMAARSWMDAEIIRKGVVL